MVKNYFKTAWRNLWRNKNFTLINITGLAVGIAVCLVIFLIIQFEQSFDGFHKNKDSIYRVLTQFHDEDGSSNGAGVPFPMPVALRNDYPDLKTSAINKQSNSQIIVLDETGNTEKKFKEETGVFFAEPNFFEIFDFPLLAGDYHSLKDPNTALVTKETAERYFGDWQLAIGKTIKKDGRDIFRITGVLSNVPYNTDFQFKIVFSYSTQKNYTTSTDWRTVSSNHSLYVMIPPGMNEVFLSNLLKDFTLKYKKGDDARNIQLAQHISKVHYDSEAGNFLERTISPKLINTLWLIAAFIILIACVNFINLATAQAINRAKEVGVRKVLGGNKIQLGFQFFCETTIITVLAVFLAIGVCYAILPFLNRILNLPLELKISNDFRVLLFLATLVISVTLLAGFYPAIILSRFNPVTALKSKLVAKRTKGISLRRALVVFQFVIAQVLIIGTLIVVKQMAYFRTKPLGFDRHAIINVPFPADSIGRSKIDYLRNRLNDIKGVQSVSFSFASPANSGNWYSNLRFNNQEKETDWIANLKWADTSYLRTYNIPLIAGRNLQASDTIREYLVNETFLQQLGISDPQDVLNKEIQLWDTYRGPVVGVFKDFHTSSFREAMPPVIIGTLKSTYRTAGIKISMNDLNNTLKNIASVWNQAYPDYVYEHQFLDERIETFYKDEARLSNLYKIFAWLAIFLSCLGLYGLASFMAIQRIKEVGIRKVLGASVKNIIVLFSKEFLILIGIAFMIAAPLAWYFMHDWLQEFVYRIQIPWWILLLGGVMAVIVALLTISFQAIKAAIANPVRSLRTE